MHRLCPSVCLTFALLAAPVRAGDWPQFLGPQRDGHAALDENLPDGFPDDGPRTVWKHTCGEGFAGPVAAGGRIFLFHRLSGSAVLECLDAGDGTEKWKAEYPTDYRDDFGFDSGPRSCPTVDGQDVFVFGAEGVLACADAATGKWRWKKDLTKELGSQKGFFGRSSAPLISGDLVLVAPGGADGAGVAAFDRKTGGLRWKSLDCEAGYASPVLLPGTGAALFFTREGVTGLRAESGAVLWSEHFRSETHASVNAATPVVIGSGSFFASACYETGAAVWTIKDGKPSRTWQAEDRLDCHYATPVLHAGHLFGFHGRQERGQELRCIDAATGKVKWKTAAMPAGHVIIAGGRLLILNERGEAILAKADPEKYTELARADVIQGGHRAPPALSGGRLYARDGKSLRCIELISR